MNPDRFKDLKSMAKDMIEYKKKCLSDPVRNPGRSWPRALPLGYQGTHWQHSQEKAGQNLLKTALMYFENLDAYEQPDEYGDVMVAVAGLEENGEDEAGPSLEPQEAGVNILEDGGEQEDQEMADDEEEQDEDEDVGGPEEAEDQQEDVQ